MHARRDHFASPPPVAGRGILAVRNRAAQPRLPTAWVRRAAAALLAERALAHASWSVWLAGDRVVRALNRQWRGKDRPTDVLSFPQDGAAGPELGDVVISYDTAQRQARDGGWTLAEEVTRLLVHGFLHLQGYDHVRGGRQAARMRREELRLAALVPPP